MMNGNGEKQTTVTLRINNMFSFPFLYIIEEKRPPPFNKSYYVIVNWTQGYWTLDSWLAIVDKNNNRGVL